MRVREDDACLAAGEGGHMPTPSPLRELGWRGDEAYDSEHVQALRQELEARNGMAGIDADIVDPAEAGYAARAAELFQRDGFVCIRDVLDARRLEAIQDGCDRIIRRIVNAEPRGYGGKGEQTHRWSFGGQAANQFGMESLPEWAVLIAPPPLEPVLRAILGDGYYCGGCGGDFCLPGATEYQRLHRVSAAAPCASP